MQPTARALGILAVGAAAVVGLGAAAQTQTATFKARLSPVPVETSTAASITGSGVVTATLTGTRLALSGTFGGMKSAATLAQVHMGVRGVRGPVEFDLTVEKAPSGSVSGSVTLTKVQVDSLRKGWFYIQIHAERAPDGNLWGWLLPL
jgi:CHRD domain-containing protein